MGEHGESKTSKPKKTKTNTTEIHKQKAVWEPSLMERETRAAKGKPLSGQKRRQTHETPVEVVVESGETKHGIHAPKRTKNSLECVRYARPYRRRWSERKLLVDDEDADESGGEERAM
jgi:hypothetical protein